jgi:hypothetical protein
MNFLEKYQTFKVGSFPSSDVRFKYYSCAFINFHEKYQTFKVHPFTSSDVRFKYLSCAFMNFHEKIPKFQISPFSRFKCDIQVLFMRFHEFSWKKKLSKFIFSQFRFEIQVLFIHFHEFSWKNIKLSKFVLFPVQMWDSSITSSISCAFMNFHEKILNFQSSFFYKFRCEIKVFFVRFHEFSWKNIKLSKFVFSQFRCEI